MDKIFEKLEKSIAPEVMDRGLQGKWSKGMLQKTAQLLLNKERLLIITGFCIPEKQIGETDGPSGALAIGYALKKLGKEVWIGTDSFTVKILKAAASVVAMEDDIYDLTETILRDHKPMSWLSYMDALVFIERPGKAGDGRNYNMAGEDITDYTLNTDVLFDQAVKWGIPVVAVGDGGNEAGMGRVRDVIETNVQHGKKICAVTEADYLILSGISNWGGYALAGALQMISGTSCLYSPQYEMEIVQTLVDHGAVDGVTKEQHYSVDGLHLNLYIENIRQIHELAKKPV